jgi:hypothetical protein
MLKGCSMPLALRAVLTGLSAKLLAPPQRFHHAAVTEAQVVCWRGGLID